MPRGSSVSLDKFTQLLGRAGCKVGNLYGCQKLVKFIELVTPGQQTAYLMITKSYELVWPHPIKQLYDLAPAYASAYARTQSILARCKGISVTGEVIITENQAWGLSSAYSQPLATDTLTAIQQRIKEIEQESGQDILPEEDSPVVPTVPSTAGGKVKLVDNYGEPIEEVFAHIVGPKGPPATNVPIPHLEESERLERASFEVGVLYPLVSLNDFHANTNNIESYLNERKAECTKAEKIENDLAFKELEIKLIKVKEVMISTLMNLQDREAALLTKAKKLESVYQSSKTFSDSPVSLNQAGLRETMNQATISLRAVNTEIYQIREDIKRQLRSYQEGLDFLLD